MDVIDKIGLFIKFGQKEHLETLQQGNLFLNKIKFFNGLKKAGIGDEVDSKLSLYGVKYKVMNKSTGATFTTINMDNPIMSFGLDECPIFSLYSFDKRNILSTKGNVVELGFNDDCARKIRAEFGEYALVILDRYRFFNSVKSFVEKNDIETDWGNVNYTEAGVNNFRQLKEINEDSKNVSFWKNKEKYEYQQEYRFVFFGLESKKPLGINIEPIEEYSFILPTEELLDLVFIFEVNGAKE